MQKQYLKVFKVLNSVFHFFKYVLEHSLSPTAVTVLSGCSQTDTTRGCLARLTGFGVQSDILTFYLNCNDDPQHLCLEIILRLKVQTQCFTISTRVFYLWAGGRTREYHGTEVIAVIIKITGQWSHYHASTRFLRWR